jgi:hypothetical protein
LQRRSPAGWFPAIQCSHFCHLYEALSVLAKGNFR